MNKYQKALSDLVAFSYVEKLTYEEEEKIQKCESILEGLVDKTVPKRGIRIIKGLGGKVVDETDVCDKYHSVVFKEYKYCPECGQLIYWGDKDE